MTRPARFLSEAGNTVQVVPAANGVSVEETFARLAATGAQRQVVLRVAESNWDAQEANKASDKYNVFDMHPCAIARSSSRCSRTRRSGRR